MVNYVIEYSLLLLPTNEVIFSHLSVILGVCLSACWDTPPQEQTPLPLGSRHPPRKQTPHQEADTPGKQTHPLGSRHTPRKQTLPEADIPSGSRHSSPPLHSACWEIRATSGWFASYWNAYLLEINVKVPLFMVS